MAGSDAARTLAIYLPDLSGGGAERLHVRLAAMFAAAGLDVTFLLDRESGELLDQVPDGCRVVSLGADRQLKALPKLTAYLRRERPDLLLANMEHMNVMAIAARALARVETRILVTQHNAFSEQAKRRSWQFKVLPALYRAALPSAAAVICVSSGVADDLAIAVGRPRSSLTVIHNGVVTEDFDERADGPLELEAFRDGAPVILGTGRLVPQKDFTTLIEAFASIADRTPARLVILGEGPLRAEVTALAAARGVADRVVLPGFVSNPLPYLKAARLFVLSSRFEGFGNVVAEALACGTPVVSTDCPHGPAEILDDGRYGALVPVGDARAMGEAILAALVSPPDGETLKARGRDFGVAACAARYMELFDAVLRPNVRSATIPIEVRS